MEIINILINIGLSIDFIVPYILPLILILNKEETNYFIDILEYLTLTYGIKKTRSILELTFIRDNLLKLKTKYLNLSKKELEEINAIKENNNKILNLQNNEYYINLRK